MNMQAMVQRAVPARSQPSPRIADVPLTKETVEDRPWTSVVIESQSKKGTTGIYGIGLKINVNQKFDVLAVTGLKDENDRSLKDKVNVGDILCYVNDRSVEKEGTKIIETTILGDLGSLLKLTLRNCKTGAMYDLMAKRHLLLMPITFTQQWYQVKEEYSGGELMTDARIVSCLDNIRHCAIDEQGREVDFLAGIKKRGSSCGIFFPPEKTAGGRKVDHVLPGSPASFHNVQPGDVISAVDGETSNERIAALLGGEQRIGSVCKVTITRQGGRKEQIEVVRTQVAAMNRVAEMLEYIEELADATPEVKTLMKKKVVELEKERQYEERVMAGRLNASNTMLLDEVWKAQETLKPQRPIVEDHTEALDDMKRTNSELSRALELANRRNEELEAELKRLRDINAGMVPAIELDDLRNQLENMKRLMADMVPKDQYNKMEASLQGIIQKLRDEKKELEDKLKASEANNTALKVENDDLKRRLKLLEEEVLALKNDAAAMKNAQLDMVSKDQYAKMEQSLQDIIAQLRAEKKALEDKLKESEKKNAVLQAENDELKRKVKGLEDENAALHKEHAALKSQLREMQAGKDGANAELESLKRQLKGAQDDLEALRKQLQAADADKGAMQVENDALKRKIKTLEDENADLRAQLEAMRKDLTAARGELDRLSRENDALKRQVEGLETANAELNKQVAALQERVKAAEAEADKWRKIAEPLQAKDKATGAELEAANAKIKALTDENNQLKDELAKLQLKLKQAETEIASLKADLAALKEELKRTKEENAEVWKQLEAAKKQIRDLTDQVAKLEQEKQSLQRELAAANDQVAKLKSDIEANLKKMQANSDAGVKQKAEIEGLKSQLQEANSKIASLESQLKSEKEANAKLSEELKKAHERAAKLQTELDKANDQIANLKEEIRKLKLQIEELERKLKAAEAEVKRLTGVVDGLTKDLAEANKKIASLEEQLDAEKKALAALKKKMEDAIAELEKKLKKAEAEAADYKKKMEELTKDLAAANKKIAGLEEQLDAEKEAHAALKKKYEDASNELSKLKSELDSSKKLLADKGAGVERLDALLRELAAAKLDDPAFRKEFLSAITDEPMLQPAGVLRLIKAAKALQPTKLDTVCELLETMTDPSIMPGDVLELLKNLRDGKPKRTAIEAQLILKVLNQEEAWSGETLLQMREALNKEGVRRPEQIIICPDRHEHSQVEFLKQRVREILAPEFEQKGCTFVHRTPLTIRGRPGSTIYACIQDESVRPTKESFDKCCESPMELVIDDSCVVTAIATMQGALEGGDDLSAPKVEAFTRKRMVTREAVEGLARAVPILPEERVGIGMLIEKDLIDHSDIVVKSITAGGEVEKDGRISVGDVLLEVDGQDLDGVDLHNVMELILGPPATEVTLVMERKGTQRSGEGVVADNLYTVRLFRTRNEAVPSTFSPQSFVDSGRKLLGGTLDSGKSLLQGIQDTAAAAAGPRPASSQPRSAQSRSAQSPALSSGRFSTINPNASAMSAQSPAITISNSPGSSFNKGPGVNSPGIYMQPSESPGAKGEVLIAM